MGYNEEEFVLNAVQELLAAKKAVDACDQFFYQLEWMWHYPFNFDMTKALQHGESSIAKTINVHALSVLVVAIEYHENRYGLNSKLTAIKDALTELLRQLTLVRTSNAGVYDYKQMFEAERLAMELSRLLHELMLTAFPWTRVRQNSGEKEPANDEQCGET